MNTHAYLNGCKVGHYLNTIDCKVIESYAALKYSYREFKREFNELKYDFHRIWKVR